MTKSESGFTSSGIEDEEDLEATLEQVRKRNDFLSRENELFAAYLQSVSPQMASSADEEEVGKTTKKPRAKSHTQQKRAPAVLTIEQKLDIASHMKDEIREKIDKAKLNAEKLLDNLKAAMEETDIRIAEIRQDLHEFKREIVLGAENFRTGKTVAEKVIRYFEESLRSKEALVEKLRLKNATLKSQIQKMEAQLHQKEEMGETLHIIDFDQLKIENQQYLEKIEERNNELLRLKLTTGNTVQVLNTLKKKLNLLTSESEYLKKEIASRQEQLLKIRQETHNVKDEYSAAHQQHMAHMKIQQENAKVPSVLEYVSEKAALYEMDKELENYRRKLEIAEMNLTRMKHLARIATHAQQTRTRPHAAVGPFPVTEFTA